MANFGVIGMTFSKWKEEVTPLFQREMATSDNQRMSWCAKHTFGVIGPGNLGEALLRKIATTAVPNFYHRRQDRCQELVEREIGVSRTLPELLECDIIFIVVKPTSAKEICGLIKPLLRGRSPLFISVMAGVPTDFLRDQLGTPQVARVMLDMSVGQLHLSRQIFAYADESLHDEIGKTCSFIGRLVWLDTEAMIDTATAIFGCGPAFVARFYQAYLDIAKKAGFNQEEVEGYVLDLFDATVYMLGNQQSASTIIQKVACKGGATERGLQHLNSLDNSLADCIGVAEKRCHELREELLQKLLQ